MDSYEITITNGTGSVKAPNGTYSVNGTVNGYDSSSITPASVTIEKGTTTYDFKIGATGTLTLHVVDDSDPINNIEGATFIRCDELGTTTYGEAITSNASGDAVFNYVPYGLNAPVLYYKQTSSIADHDFDTV